MPMLAQTETKSKAPFGNRNGRTDKSNGLDPQFAKLKKDLSLALREIRFQISRTNYTKPRRISRRNVQSAVPRAERMIPWMRRLVAREPVNKLNEPRHRGRELHLQVRHGRVSEYFRLVTTVTRRRKMIIRNRMQEQHTQRQILLAFNQLSRRRLHDWMLSPDLQGQGQGKL
jgi:hypothetical protein